MKIHLVALLAALASSLAGFAAAGDAAEKTTPKLTVAVPDPALSLRNEVQRAIERGLAWLQAQQNTNGWWSAPDHPALTGLALIAFENEPRRRYATNEPPWLQKGYAYLFGCAQPDGGIHQGSLVTYNTAVCLVALVVADKPEYETVISKARAFLVGLQRDFGEKGKVDDVFDGGIGYGTSYDHSDMSNTLAALEALRLSRQFTGDKAPAAAPDLNWAAAIHFLQNCQNLPACNKQPWVADDPENKGGFVYYPGHSMAGAITNAATGRVTLRSYGSISYAGLLSYIYADLRRDDPRVAAVLDWLRANYTLDENPGLGAQGYYYYLHTMTKALTVARVEQMPLKNGQSVDWRTALAQKLIDLQRADGSWYNDNGRWWEKDPALVTAYVVHSLEMIHRQL